MTSTTQMTPDTNPESLETSSPKAKHSKDTEQGVMAKVNAERMKMVRQSSEAQGYVETSDKMVKHFAGDPDYKQNYVIVSGVKVFIEGTVDETEAKEALPCSHRM